MSIAWYDSENKPVNKELFTVGDLEREPSGSATTHQTSKLALNSDMTTKDSSFFCNFTINRALTEGLSTAVDVFSKFRSEHHYDIYTIGCSKFLGQTFEATPTSVCIKRHLSNDSPNRSRHEANVCVSGNHDNISLYNIGHQGFNVRCVA